MRLERPAASASMVDALERVLDKGIVIDAWMRLSEAGISFVAVETRVIVESIEMYVKRGSRRSVRIAGGDAGRAHPRRTGRLDSFP